MTDGAPRALRRGRGWRAALLRCVSVATSLLYGVLIAAGALVHPSSVVLFGPVSAVIGGVALVGLRRSLVGDQPPPLHPVVGAALAGGLPAALSGLDVLGPWGGVAVALVLAGAAVLVENWITSSPGLPLSAPLGAPRWNEEGVRRLLAAMPTELLLEEWRASRQDLIADAGDRLRAVRLRDLLIDELQARDPSATARWLSGDTATPPAPYLRKDGPSSSDAGA